MGVRLLIFRREEIERIHLEVPLEVFITCQLAQLANLLQSKVL